MKSTYPFRKDNFPEGQLADAVVEIRDLSGRIVYSEAAAQEMRIALHELPGLYTIRLISPDAIAIQKLILK